MKKNKYVIAYNHIYFYMWEITMANGDGTKGIYKGAILFSRFILSEISRYQEVLNSGEAAIERRGLVSPISVMKGWAYEILDDCYQCRIVPPKELCHVIYNLMECHHRDEATGKHKERSAFHEIRKRNPNISIRQAAKEAGVDKRTGTRWKKQGINWEPNSEGPEDIPDWAETFPKIQKLTRYENFLPIKFKQMRKRRAETK